MNGDTKDMEDVLAKINNNIIKLNKELEKIAAALNLLAKKQ